jgi:hypothetical protein
VLRQLVLFHQHTNEVGDITIAWQDIERSGALDRTAKQCYTKYKYLQEIADRNKANEHERVMNGHSVNQHEEIIQQQNVKENSSGVDGDGWTASEVCNYCYFVSHIMILIILNLDRSAQSARREAHSNVQRRKHRQLGDSRHRLEQAVECVQAEIRPAGKGRSRSDQCSKASGSGLWLLM